MIYINPLELIGNTPLLKLNSLSNLNTANIYVKLEMYNFTGSVKDRSALGMIIAAEKIGKLKKNSTIIESTSGNLGISLAAISNIKGYKFIAVVDPKIEQEKINILRAYNAKIIMVKKPDQQRGYQIPRINKVKELLGRIPNSINLNQYDNFNNPNYNYLTTGPEIYKDLGGKINILIGAVSTGGHLCGTAKYLKGKNKYIHVIGVEPRGSVIFGEKYKPYLQQGSGLSFIPKNYNPDLIDEKIKVSDKDAFRTALLCAKKESILIGGSSGAVLYVAVKIAKKYSIGKNIVAILPDHGEKYLTTIYSPTWLKNHGFNFL